MRLSTITLLCMAVIGLSASMATANDYTVSIQSANHGDPDLGFTPLSLMIAQGVYNCTLISGAEAGTGFSAWSIAYGQNGTWNTVYRIRLEDETEYIGGGGPYATEQEAFDATKNFVLQINVPYDQVVRFYVNDIKMVDNRGLVNVLMTNTSVPTEQTPWGGIKSLYR